MSKKSSLVIPSAIVFLIAGLTACATNRAQGAAEKIVSRGASDSRGDFAGSETCNPCHKEIYDKWEKTLHARMMQDARRNPDAILGDMAQSLPFSRVDIKYTLGSHWTQRYLTEIEGEYYVLPRMWSIQSREWLPYSIFSWKEKPWRVYCAGCHTTGYNAETGAFAETSIGCEACHAPGAKHVKNPSAAGLIVNPAKLSKERSLMVCESCHVRGTDNGNPEFYFPLRYSPGDDLSETYTPLDRLEGENVARAFHRIYDEWKDKVSQPEGTSCELCQNFRAPNEPAQVAHDSSEPQLICYTCHNLGEKLEDHTHHKKQMECTDCHIPVFSKSGGSQDIHSHRFQFRTPSKYLAYESCYETKIAESCSACHSDKSINWAIKAISEWDVRPFKRYYKVGD